MKTYTLVSLILFFPMTFQAIAEETIAIAPTVVPKTKLRGGAGRFGAPRENGTHAGVDIVAILSSKNRDDYAVKACGNGVIAYARINGSQTTGYGYTVIVDHQNGQYTLYAHLATMASDGVVKVGEQVERGQLLGYMADLENNDPSSGNAESEAVAPADKIQLHFELFKAPSGRSSTGSINDTIKKDAELVDPTSRLNELGLKE